MRGSLTYGYSSSIIASTIGQPGWYRYFELPLEHEPGYARVTTRAIATANGLYSTGGAIGTLFIMWFAQAYGRKSSIQFGAVLSLLGGLLQGGALALSMFHVGRVVSGIGIGILVTVCPMYLAELSTPNIRGFFVGQHAIFLVVGYTLAGWLGYACYFASRVNESFAWRFPLIFQSVSPLLLLVCSFFIPRSPRWLVSKGRLDDAWKTLQKIRASPQDSSHSNAQNEFHQIREQIRLEDERVASTGHNRWMACWTKKSYRKRMMLGFLTQWGAEFAGPLVINNYAVILYTGLGVSGSMPLLLSAVWLTTAGNYGTVIYNPLGAWLHDQVNSRRLMFLTGLTGCLITTSCLVGVTAVYAGTDNKIANGFGIFFIFFYLTFQGHSQDDSLLITAKLSLEEISAVFGDEVAVAGLQQTGEEAQGLGQKVEMTGLEVRNGRTGGDLRAEGKDHDGATEEMKHV
ncbi:hypothetical protein NHQ30_002004 [Ciborinia camelliae]|nr:hypothetical protein NHQ30_002004 [Ciborinia camelliae]